MQIKKMITLGLATTVCCMAVLTGCGNTETVEPKEQYSAKFSVDTGEVVEVSVDETSDYYIEQKSDGFSVVSKGESSPGKYAGVMKKDATGDADESDAKDEESADKTDDSTAYAADITGVFLSPEIANNTQAKFHEAEDYKTVTVDGKEGFAFVGEGDNDILTYVYIVPCSDDANTYVELFSTVSESELELIVPSLHIEVVE